MIILGMAAILIVYYKAKAKTAKDQYHTGG